MFVGRLPFDQTFFSSKTPPNRSRSTDSRFWSSASTYSIPICVSIVLATNYNWPLSVCRSAFCVNLPKSLNSISNSPYNWLVIVAFCGATIQRIVSSCFTQMNRESPLVAASDTTVEFSSQCFWDLSGMCFFPFSNCASSVCVQTNAPHARWGSTPNPLNIIGQPMMSWKAYPGIIGNRSALSHGNTFIYHLVHCRCHLVNMKGQNKLFLVFSFRSQHT